MAYENEKAERDFRMNPPQDAPGQGDNGWGDLFDQMPTGSSSAEPISQNNTMGSENMGMQNNMYGMNSPQAQMQQSQMQGTQLEDKLIDGTIKAGKGLISYIKYLIISLKNNTKGDWHKLGVRIAKISFGGLILGLVFSIIEIFTRNGNKPIDLMIGSLLSLIVGIFLCMFYDKEEESEPVPEPEPITDYSDFSFNNESFDEDSTPFDFGEEDNESFEINEESDFDFSFDDEDFGESAFSGVDSNDFNLEEAINNVSEIQQGTQTRQYLFETFMKVLPTMNPGFADMRNISTESDEFFMFENLMRSAAYQVGTKDENIPELETLYENDFIYRLNCTRPIGIKEQAIADEVASAFSRDDNNREIRFGCYATIETSVGKFTINVFKGTERDRMGKSKGGATISLGDVYSQIKDFICNPSIEIPLVWGINELGDIYYCDMKDNNSIIISGEPRGGKSWKGQSIIAQIAMFLSPKEVEFYFFDGKNTASDYRYLSTVLPHAKYFCGDMDKINNGLEKVIEMMVEERGKKITEAGCINIKDYNRTHPQDKLPYTYVIIDELQSLMGHFVETDQKEEGARFRSFLSTMVSKLPYTGIRFILFPHRIVNDVISKNTYSLVSCRAVVRQTNFGELKNAVDVTEKTFPYKLAQTGDMALKINEIAGGNVVFCHSEILTSSNESNRNLFDFIGGVWRKLEPDCECITINGAIGGSIGKKASEKVKEKINKPTIDYTEGEESFKYQGFNEGSSINDVFTETEDTVSDELDVDSEFWDIFG